MSSNSDLVIDHTFNRNKFIKIANQKILIGQNFFPFFVYPKKKKEILY